jgi:choline dehydrogenase
VNDRQRASVLREVDTVVIGGGTAGAVVAGLLAEQSDERVLVLEAGPDYGPFGDSRWPEDLLDARALGYTHDWNYASGDTYPNRVVNFQRARVIGGCSSHNGCAAIWGSRVDYDGWADMGLAGWSSAELLPLFARAAERLRVRRYAQHEVTPFQQACLDAAQDAGIPLTDDLNDFDQDEGMATSPVNILDGTRWNAAFAYLDPARQRPNLTIDGRSPRDRGRCGDQHSVHRAGRSRRGCRGAVRRRRRHLWLAGDPPAIGNRRPCRATRDWRPAGDTVTGSRSESP